MKKFDTINVIPFIDIMLVLLAIVLTTATFISQGQLDIALPKASNDNAASTLDRREIAIDAAENLFFDGQAITLPALQNQLKGLESKTPLLLRIDETVPFNRFVEIIDLLKTLSLDDVSILTKKVSSNAKKAQQ